MSAFSLVCLKLVVGCVTVMVVLATTTVVAGFIAFVHEKIQEWRK